MGACVEKEVLVSYIRRDALQPQHERNISRDASFYM
jgi:hypothetical protein